jgi:hypothetical protein
MISSRDKDKIIKMWEDGLSGTQIGEKLGFTRNVIIGIISRLRHKGHVFNRDEKQIREKRLEEEKKNGGVKNQPFRAKKKLSDQTIKLEIPEMPVRSGGIDLIDLKRTSCRFIISGEDTVVRYCGEEQARGAYCAEHYKICYYPARSSLEKLLKI